MKVNGIKNKHAPLWGELLSCCGTPVELGVCCVCVCAYVTVISLFLLRYFLAFHSKHFQQGSLLGRLNFSSYWRWLNLNLVLCMAPKEEIEIWREIWRMRHESKGSAHANPPVKHLSVFMSLWVRSSAPSCSQAMTDFFSDSWMLAKTLASQNK